MEDYTIYFGYWPKSSFREPEETRVCTVGLGNTSTLQVGQDCSHHRRSIRGRQNEEITSDISRDSFLPEQLPEASFELELTAPVPHRTIQTRTQTALGQGIPRRRSSHFG